MQTPSPRRLPPLAALRAFATVSRFLIVQKAADDLGVTAAAVSQQVKALEADLGVALLRRLHRGVELTETGRQLSPDLVAGFARLSAGVAALRASERTGWLTVSAAPSLAAKWLNPRLGGFRAAHPDIEVKLIAENTICDFDRDGVDIALRYGQGSYRGCVSHPFLPADVTPVGSPRLFGRAAAQLGPADLLTQVLLHDTNSEGEFGLPGWSDWFRSAGIETAKAGMGPRFSNTHLVLEAAIAGRGVALAVQVLAADDIGTGRLVRPFRESLCGAAAYWIVLPKGGTRRPKVQAFCDWLMVEAQQH